MIPKFIKLSLALVPVFLAAGCGGGTADVSGTVVYNGTPVKSGSVTVRTPDGAVFACNIDNGNYAIAGVPAGPVTFAVVSPDPAAQAPGAANGQSPGRGPPAAPKPGAAKKPTAGWFPIPAVFADPEKSGLSTSLKSGPNTFPLTLTDR